MVKRHSPRELSYTPASTADSEDDVHTEDVQKPTKRLKTTDDSTAASPSIAAGHDLEDGDNDAEMENGTETENGRAVAKPGKRTAKAEADRDADADVEAEADADPDATQHMVASEQLLEALSDISEDTDGEVPHPKGSNLHGDDDGFEKQVTVCAWDGCKTGDLHTMDRLVEHLHAEHVEGKQRRYTCEWVGCSRKGKSHASAYALKAHLRSHTREKPYVCHLPECDQAFARADALGKHIRSSHDVDLMRSIDPPRPVGYGGGSKHGAAAYGNGTSKGSVAAGSASNGGKGVSEIKIIMKTPQSHAAGQDDSIDYSQAQSNGLAADSDGAGAGETVLAREHGFSAQELEMPLEKLHGLCRCQLAWAEEEGEALRKECAVWEEQYHRAWLERQLLLDQVIQSEKDWFERRQAVLASLAEEQKRLQAEAVAAGEPGVREDEDDSAGEDDSDNDDGTDADVTLDGYSMMDASSFSVVGSQLRHEVSLG